MAVPWSSKRVAAAKAAAQGAQHADAASSAHKAQPGPSGGAGPADAASGGAGLADAASSEHKAPAPVPWHRTTKVSVGVIVCRRAPATGRVEALLVRKRYTYAFADFVLGRYPRGRALAAVAPLLDAMTRDELLDVWSLSFAQMWYRVWLARGDVGADTYRAKAAAFDAAFGSAAAGAALRRAAERAAAAGVLAWEPPRGRHLHERETDVACAAREVREETGVDKREYRLLPGVARRAAHVSAGTRYMATYFVAVAHPRLAAWGPRAGGWTPAGPDGARPPIRDDGGGSSEVSEVRWHDLERLRAADPDGRLEALVAPALRLARCYFAGGWAAR